MTKPRPDKKTFNLYIKDPNGNYQVAGLREICQWWNTVYPADIFVGSNFEPWVKNIEEAWGKFFPLPKKLISKELQKRNDPFAPEIRGVRFLLNILAKML